MKILIVEDEPKTGAYLKQGLSEAGFVADLVHDGVDGRYMAVSELYDLVVLDVNLPGLSGWEVLRSVRATGSHVPVLFLTARDQVEDRVKGLELGADDYLSSRSRSRNCWRGCARSCAAARRRNRNGCRSQTWSSTCCAAASRAPAGAST